MAVETETSLNKVLKEIKHPEIAQHFMLVGGVHKPFVGLTDQYTFYLALSEPTFDLDKLHRSYQSLVDETNSVLGYPGIKHEEARYDKSGNLRVGSADFDESVVGTATVDMNNPDFDLLKTTGIDLAREHINGPYEINRRTKFVFHPHFDSASMAWKIHQTRTYIDLNGLINPSDHPPLLWGVILKDEIDALQKDQNPFATPVESK